MSTKETNTTKAKNKADQEELFQRLNENELREVLQVFGVREDKIPADATRDDLLKLIDAAKRHDIAVAKTVKTPDGKEYDCPPGHMVIKVTPKTGIEWGSKVKSFAFFAVQGNAVVVRRGETVVIPDKYRSAWRDAVRVEYDDQAGASPTIGPDGNFVPLKLVGREVYAEDVQELYWNRDLEAEEAVERDLKEGAARAMKARQAAQAMKEALINNVVR
jgi:hypothetical protein